MAHLEDPDQEIGSLTAHLDGEPAHAIVSNQRQSSIDIKTNVLGVLPTFFGRRNEGPYEFLNEFSKLCSIQKRPTMPLRRTTACVQFHLPLKERPILGC